MNEKELIGLDDIKSRIYTIRGMQVMLDSDLAKFYSVKPIKLREQVKRNIKRFPSDFMFQLTKAEADFMVSQNAIPSKKHLGGFLPYVFTEQGIFFNGQIFDAYKFVSDLIRSAEKSIVLIDNFVDDTVLTLFSKRKDGVYLKILTKEIRKQLRLDMKKFNEQFPPAEIQKFDQSHDRFLIIDESEVYHIGASLKDLGKKWFAFSKMDFKAARLLTKI